MILAIDKFPVKVPVAARKNAAPAVRANCFKRNIDNRLAYNRGGFTLIELLVYMAIMGFIIVVAGRAFSDSTSMRVRSQSMLSSAEEAGRVSALLKEDISQMGAKKWVKDDGNFEWTDKVRINTGDSSSFVLTKNKPATAELSFDSLAFYKAHYDNNGICGAVLKIEWYVNKDTLWRKCTQTQDSKCTGSIATSDCPGKVEMASNVTEFRFLPSKPGVQPSSGSSYSPPSPSHDILFEENPFTFTKVPNNTTVQGNNTDGLMLGISNSSFDLNSSSSGTTANNYLLGDGAPRRFKFKAGEEYAIEFELPYDAVYGDCKKESCSSSEKVNDMAMFQAGSDHLSIGLRNTSNNAQLSIPDFLFYPPQQGDIADKIKRHFTFSVPREINDIDAYIGITAAFYSEAGKGYLKFQNFKVYRKTDRVYHFNDEPSNDDWPPDNLKYSVKAFKLAFSIDKRGEVTSTVTVIPVPNNGTGGG